MNHLAEELNSWAEPGTEYPSRGAASPRKAPRVHAAMVPLKVNSHWQHLEGNLESSDGIRPAMKGLHVCGFSGLCFQNGKICSYSSL